MGGPFVNPALAFDFQYPPQLVSAGFNGSTQRLSTTGSASTAMGTGDFTWECWIRPTASTGYQTFIDTRGYSTGYSAVGTDGAVFGLDNNTLTPYYFSNSGAVITSTINLTLNAWTYVAVVRNSGTTTLYVNGVSGGSVAGDTTNLSAPYVNIGGVANLGPNYLTGQISNLRMVKGTAVYTSNFTVPTKPLTPITNTSLLVSMGATPFIDTSTNAFTITNTGTVVTNNLSPFPATWTDSLNGIVATVATLPNAASTSNPKYDGRYGGGIVMAQTSQSYVDVPTARGPGGGFTISMAAVLPIAQGDHYVAIFDGSIPDRAGQYINARNWVGDGLEVGGQATWAASNSTTVPSMQTLAWWDFVFNGQIINVYKNGAAVAMANSDMGAGNSILGWRNPLRFAGDDSIAANNTMWPGTLYRMIHTKTALTAGQVTTQFAAVRSTYGL
jgi:hypothetical protein